MFVDHFEAQPRQDRSIPQGNFFETSTKPRQNDRKIVLKSSFYLYKEKC